MGAAEGSQSRRYKPMNAKKSRFAMIHEETIRSPAWKKLNATALRVFTALALHANNERLAYPAVATLSKYVGVTVENTRKALRQLENQGFIENVRSGGGRGRATIYRVGKHDRAATGFTSDTETRVARERSDKTDRTLTDFDDERGSQQSANPDDARAKTRSLSDPPTTKDHTEKHVVDEVADKLWEAGLRSKSLIDKIASFPGITVEACTAVLARRRLDWDSEPSFIATVLRYAEQDFIAGRQPATGPSKGTWAIDQLPPAERSLLHQDLIDDGKIEGSDPIACDKVRRAMSAELLRDGTKERLKKRAEEKAGRRDNTNGPRTDD